MRAAWAAGIVIGIVACHRSAEVQPWPRELGEYSYRIGATPVYGKFTILPDTVTLEAQQHSCRRLATGVLDPGIHPFRCVGGSMDFSVVVDSRHPRLSTWRSARPVKKTVETCTQYGFTTTGQKVCTKSRTEVKTVSSGGPLEITRIDVADKP